MSNFTGDGAIFSSINTGEQEVHRISNTEKQGFNSQPPSQQNLLRSPDPIIEFIALSPTTLMTINQNHKLHKKVHNLSWKRSQWTSTKMPRKQVYVCPEPTCVHHNPARALRDLTAIKKHFLRKHGEKKWSCDKCSKKYAVHYDLNAHQKICETREYKCDSWTMLSRPSVMMQMEAPGDVAPSLKLYNEESKQPQGCSKATMINDYVEVSSYIGDDDDDDDDGGDVNPPSILNALAEKVRVDRERRKQDIADLKMKRKIKRLSKEVAAKKIKTDGVVVADIAITKESVIETQVTREFDTGVEGNHRKGVMIGAKVHGNMSAPNTESQSSHNGGESPSYFPFGSVSDVVGATQEQIMATSGINVIFDDDKNSGVVAFQISVDLPKMEREFNNLMDFGQRGYKSLNAALSHSVNLSNAQEKIRTELEAQVCALEKEKVDLEAKAKLAEDRVIKAEELLHAAEKAKSMSYQHESEALKMASSSEKRLLVVFEENERLAASLVQAGVRSKILKSEIEDIKAKTSAKMDKIVSDFDVKFKTEMNGFYRDGWADSAQYCRMPLDHKVWTTKRFNISLPYQDDPVANLVPLSPRHESDTEEDEREDGFAHWN